ncbi:branched-chain amino acid aminotransferase/4-amino-4-deoxychorismate lyase [Marinitoga piezophila KA3]|uniref:Branched-chain amino acid aminotransferase/4-amino-4-deoxychorismate lyase n=1 Tax=Marinitoga piezophila (strain DSM 14283 / JCM 11233 / KA3) TaxID=443254 RepID=H2J3Y7_MARPK|nr:MULTISPECIES: aminotransferase class IV [Marinitoga]AEX84715.1 branched-chain amino acid aminotransferase/4-amino-4-deoxychorismate lyase [Marinitoga piezophila KA3]APT75240.1 aminotransferase IV [Marinitoga sp. 1137]
MFYNSKEWIESTEYKSEDFEIFNGYSTYETIRTYNKNLFALNFHYERLKKSAIFLGLEFPEYNKLKETLLEGVKKFNCKEDIRIKILINKYTSKNKSFYAFIEPIYEVDDLRESGVVLAISRERKPKNPVIPYYVKTSLNGYGLYLRQKYNVYYDAIVLNEFGYVTEGTKSNLFMVSAGVIITPPLSAGILPGITRKVVIDLIKSFNIDFEERNIELWELLSADEIFLTHTSAGIVPVRRIVPNFTFNAPGITTETLINYWKDFIIQNNEYWD